MFEDYNPQRYQSPLASMQAKARTIYQVIDNQENVESTFRNEYLADRHARALGLQVRPIIIDAAA